MKSIRLNKTLRANIAKAINDAYVAKNPAPEYQTREELAVTLHNCILKEYMKEVAALKAKIGKVGISMNMLRTSSGFSVYISGDHWKHISFEGPSVYNYEIDLAPHAAYMDLSTTKNTVVLEEYAKYLRDCKTTKAKKDIYDAWELTQNNYMQDVRDVLDGVNTTAQLLEVWPEAEVFIPKGIVDPSRILLPSVCIANLNAKI